MGRKKKIHVLKSHRKCFTAAQYLREVNTSRCTREKSHLPGFVPNLPLRLRRCKLLSHSVAFENVTSWSAPAFPKYLFSCISKTVVATLLLWFSIPLVYLTEIYNSTKFMVNLLYLTRKKKSVFCCFHTSRKQNRGSWCAHKYGRTGNGSREMGEGS